MGQTLYGARLWQTEDNGANLRYDILGKNSEVFAANDIVGTSGNDLYVGTDPVVGVVVKAQTMASTNVTVAKVYPGYIVADPNTPFLMGTNSDLTSNATDFGTYYGVTGATGAQQVDVTTGARTTTARTVMIVKVDPYNEGGTGAGSGVRKVLVRFVNTPHLNIEVEG